MKLDRLHNYYPPVKWRDRAFWPIKARTRWVYERSGSFGYPRLHELNSGHKRHNPSAFTRGGTTATEVTVCPPAWCDAKRSVACGPDAT